MAMSPAERQRAYYAKNKDRALAVRKKSYEKNREKVLARDRARIEAIKQDPEAYRLFLEHRRELYRARREAGKIPAYRENKKRYDDSHRPQLREKTNARRRQQRERAIEAYGGLCVCCGEDRFEFLAIDHVDGGGAQHRKSLRASDRREFCNYLAKLGYPDGYRVLCHNCNLSLGLYGYCPHERRGAEADHL